MRRATATATRLAERRAAFAAWQAQVNRAFRLGRPNLAAKHRPREIAGAAEINRCAAALAAALDRVETGQPA
jgi:hypothetical protein